MSLENLLQKALASNKCSGNESEFIQAVTPEKSNIFQAKTLNEISNNYDKLLVNYGKWNAKMYLKIQEELNRSETFGGPICGELEENVGKKKCPNFFITTKQTYSSDEPKNEYSYASCNREKPSGPIYIPTDILPPTEPSYKSIFKNATAQRGKPKTTAVVSSAAHRSHTITKIKTASELVQSIKEQQVHKNKKCELMENSNNNYIRNIREKKCSSKTKHSRDTSSDYPEVDTIGKFFAEKSIEHVLGNHLVDVVELIKANIGERIVPNTPEEDATDMARLNWMITEARGHIDEFQERLLDGRWRRKFELDKIEISEEEDSTDVSDIYPSDSSSRCTGDSLDSSLDLKIGRPKLSRIPYMNETNRKRDVIFDKIALKWEKVVKKNVVEPIFSMTPSFWRFYGDIRMRSDSQIYDKILKILISSYGSMYSKKFKPYKHRIQTKLVKIEKMREEKNFRANQRRMVESTNTTAKPGVKRKEFDWTLPKLEHADQSKRINYIMKEAALRGSEGLSIWTKSHLRTTS